MASLRINVRYCSVVMLLMQYKSSIMVKLTYNQTVIICRRISNNYNRLRCHCHGQVPRLSNELYSVVVTMVLIVGCHQMMLISFCQDGDLARWAYFCLSWPIPLKVYCWIRCWIQQIYLLQLLLYEVAYHTEYAGVPLFHTFWDISRMRWICGPFWQHLTKCMLSKIVFQ